MTKPEIIGSIRSTYTRSVCMLCEEKGIEYLLTPLGESLRPVLESLIDWGVHHANELGEGDRLLPCEAVVRPIHPTPVADRRPGARRHDEGQADRG